MDLAIALQIVGAALVVVAIGIVFGGVYALAAAGVVVFAAGVSLERGA